MPTVVTWNLRHGGGSRNMPAIALSLLDHSPDVAVLSEFRRTTGGQIAGVLADHGLSHQLSTNPPAESNGLLIASRAGLQPLPPPTPATPRSAKAMSLRLAMAAIPDLDFHLIAAHVPCEGSGRDAVFSTAVAAAARLREKPCLLIGDLNAGRHELDEEGRTFTCTRLLGLLAVYGYVDAWRAIHGQSREYTWYSHDGHGFRIDHAFISPALATRLTGCRYSHQERHLGLSDHSALIVELL